MKHLLILLSILLLSSFLTSCEKKMVLERKLMKMVQVMWEYSRMEREMVKEHTLMEKGNGKETSM